MVLNGAERYLTVLNGVEILASVFIVMLEISSLAGGPTK
jgi:hypothetical protein